MNQLPTVHIPNKQVREKRALITYRQRLVKYRRGIKNAIRAIFSREGITTVPKCKKAWSKGGLLWLRAHAKPLKEIEDINQLWRGQLHVELEKFEAISKSLKKVEDKLNKIEACTERQGKISGQGNKILRNLLVEICWVSLRYNPWVRDTYKRLLRGSRSRKKIAITALARKLVLKYWVMLRYEQNWKNDIQKNVA